MGKQIKISKRYMKATKKTSKMHIGFQIDADGWTNWEKMLRLEFHALFCIFCQSGIRATTQKMEDLFGGMFKLTDSNYSVWKLKMRDMLVVKDFLLPV